MRSPFVIGATLAGVAGIVAFHPHASTGPAATFAAPGTHAVGGSSTQGGGSTAGAPPATGSAPTTTTTAPTTTTTVPGAAPTAPAAHTATAPAAAGAPSPSPSPSPPPTTVVPAPTTTTAAPLTTSPGGSASGSVTTYRFGSLQVTATVSGGRLTNVSTQVQSSDSRSQQIDNGALPVLRTQALSAQRATVQGVSGATYTSQAFRTSLQSALSALGFK